jgi:hypothetical protein
MSDASELFLAELAGVFQQHQRGTPATSCSRVIRLMRENPGGVLDLIAVPGGVQVGSAANPLTTECPLCRQKVGSGGYRDRTDA